MYSLSIMSTMVSQFKCILCQSWLPWYHSLDVFSVNHEYHGITVLMYSVSIMSTMVSQFRCILYQSWVPGYHSKSGVPWYHSLDAFSFNHEYHGITVNQEYHGITVVITFKFCTDHEIKKYVIFIEFNSSWKCTNGLFSNQLERISTDYNLFSSKIKTCFTPYIN